MITLEIVGTDRAIARLRKIEPQLQPRLEAKILELALRLQRDVQSNRLNGQALNRRTGRLAASITTRMVGQGSTQPHALVGTNVSYGRIHELGGTFQIPEHMRRGPSGAMHSVRAHPATFPPRSFLRSALADMEGRIRSELTQTVRDAARTSG